jgi:arylsulfatase A
MLETLTERYNDEIESFLDTAAKNTSQPFFLYVAHNQVHVQLYASKNFLGKSKRGLYGDAAQEMDNSVGVLLNKLKSLGLDSNTFVFFSSDNGPWLEQKLDGGSAGPFKGGKGSTWEGGLRMPGIAWWPGKIAPMQVQQEVATSLDIFPTFLDVAGVPRPPTVILDGVSLVPLIFQGQPVHTSDVLFFYRDNLIYAARFQAFKAHFVTRSGFNLDPPVHHSPPLLFNIEQDPGEHWPLDPTESNNAAILKIIIAAVENQQKTVVPATPQLNPSYMLDPLVSPCCNGTFPIGCSC